MEKERRKPEMKPEEQVSILICRHPILQIVRQDIIDAYLLMEECYRHDGKILIAGNGGSAADAEHIAGELMKSFKMKRSVTREFATKLKGIDPERGEKLSHDLERGLTAIPYLQDLLSGSSF